MLGRVMAGLLAVAGVGAGMALGPAPALAQLTGSCAVHKEKEIRCATNYTLQGTRVVAPKILFSSVPTGTSATASLWVSECGSQGRSVGSQPISGGRSRVEFNHQTIGVANGPPRSYCLEVFVTGCMQGGPQSCVQVFPLNSIRMDVALGAAQRN